MENAKIMADLYRKEIESHWNPIEITFEIG